MDGHYPFRRQCQRQQCVMNLYAPIKWLFFSFLSSRYMIYLCQSRFYKFRKNENKSKKLIDEIYIWCEKVRRVPLQEIYLKMISPQLFFVIILTHNRGLYIYTTHDTCVFVCRMYLSQKFCTLQVSFQQITILTRHYPKQISRRDSILRLRPKPKQRTLTCQ